jgi:glutaredoxin
LILINFCDLIKEINKNMNKTIIFITIGVVVLVAGFWVWQSGFFGPNQSQVQPVPIPEGIILFYGDGCPHCKNVDDFMSQNDILSKIQITQLEVYNDKDNQNILAQVAQKCGIATDQVGVPFLYDGQNCTVGDEPIIDWMKQKTGIQ